MGTKLKKMLGSLESDQDLNTTDNVIFNSLSTYNLSLEEYSQSVSNFLNDAGCITHPVLTDNGDGTATISSTEVALYDSDNSSGTLTKYVLDEVTLTFVDGEEEYVVADYNEGSPIIRKETDKDLINCSDVCIMMICWRQGTTIHSVDQDSFEFSTIEVKEMLDEDIDFKDYEISNWIESFIEENINALK